MKTEERKYKKQVAPESVPEFLRKLANAFETEHVAGDDFGELVGFIKDYQKLSLDIKPKSDLVSIRLRIKKSAPEAPAPFGATHAPLLDPGPTKPKYKILKKQMQTSFKTIQASLSASRLPEDDLLFQFCDDSALMTTYPGKGDVRYSEYTQVVAQLKTAFERKDYSRFKSAFETIGRLKKECHQYYK